MQGLRLGDSDSASVVALALGAEEGGWPGEFASGYHYRGLSLFWSGWFLSPYDPEMVGKWRAWPLPGSKLDRYFHALVPAGPAGEGFNPPAETAIVSDLTMKSAVTERRAAIKAGLEALRGVIDQALDRDVHAESGARI